jgi:hypothetical protein
MKPLINFANFAKEFLPVLVNFLDGVGKVLAPFTVTMELWRKHFPPATEMVTTDYVGNVVPIVEGTVVQNVYNVAKPTIESVVKNLGADALKSTTVSPAPNPIALSGGV